MGNQVGNGNGVFTSFPCQAIVKKISADNAESRQRMIAAGREAKKLFTTGGK